jgi:translation initiation factor IF-3
MKPCCKKAEKQARYQYECQKQIAQDIAKETRQAVLKEVHKEIEFFENNSDVNFTYIRKWLEAEIKRLEK